MIENKLIVVFMRPLRDQRGIILAGHWVLQYLGCRPVYLVSKYWSVNLNKLADEILLCFSEKLTLKLMVHDNFEETELFTTLDHAKLISGKAIYLNKIAR